MPTPRQHGGTGLLKFPLTIPGFKGLNTQRKNGILEPEWATRLVNSIIDENGRLAARHGWDSQTGTPHGDPFVEMIEYVTSGGTTRLVATTATQVLHSINDGDTWVNVTGTAAFTSGQWHLVNFDNEIIGFQSGEQPLRYNGTTSSQISDGGNEPTGGVGTAAFGRVWAADNDGVTLQYSGLLNAGDWSTADAGSFDLSNVWPGNDTITAVAQHNNFLVVFGQNSIIIFADSTGSELGIDPTAMVVEDIINGLGCLTQKSVRNVKGDLWFLGSDYNLHSLGRVIQEKSAPTYTLSLNVADELRDSITLTTLNLAELRTVYSPTHRFFLISMPMESAPGELDEIGRTWVFDTRGSLEDGSVRCLGIWTGLVPITAVARQNGDFITSLRTVEGEVGLYTGETDDTNPYTFSYESGWLVIPDLAGYLLILKRLEMIAYVNRDTDVILKWAFDFRTTFNTRAVTFTGSTGLGEFGISEWGVGEFSGGVAITHKRIPGAGTGEFIKIGATAEINGGGFAVQQVNLLPKIGRLG